MRTLVDAVVAPCSHEAAKYAVMHWHYSRRMLVTKLAKFGVWEHSAFVGAIIYGPGPSDALGKRWGLTGFEVCELGRVAMRTHSVPVSAVVAESLRQLQVANPGLRLVVSFADPAQGHVGGIYQAGNWLYLGTTSPDVEYFVNGRWMHSRAVPHKRQMGRPPTRNPAELATLRRRPLLGKHRYCMPLDRAMRRVITPHAKPYPKLADEGSTASRPNTVREGRVQSPESAPRERATA